MRIVIDDADSVDWSINVYDCKNPDDMTIASLVTQLFDFNYMYIGRHHGLQAGTITDLVEHINDEVL